MSKTQHITAPAGFTAAGVACGIKASGKADLAIIAADGDASAAILTTQNQVVGAPVLYCRGVLPKGYGKVRGMVINAGNANTLNGPTGAADAAAMARQTAQRLGAKPERVLVASTGIIGHPLPMAQIAAGIDAAAGRLARGRDQEAMAAILTTDTRAKSAVESIRVGGRTVTLAGMAKGAGMIAPSMATMIAVLTTDAAITPPALHKALTAATAGSFNAVTVDSDTSTSDTLVAMASGAAGNRTLTASSRDYKSFAAALSRVCQTLARAIAADGEGATKLIEVSVTAARSAGEAEAAAKAVANSPLFKCAVHGADPNWGRIVMALGKSAARVDPSRLRVKIGGVCVFSAGRGRRFNVPAVRRHLRGKTVRVACDLGLGGGRFTALTCDLSREYITINADYHT